MAQKVSVTLEDDIDGSEAVETIVFALNGQSYEIDLNEKNAGKFRKALAPFVEAGRKQSAKRGAAAPKRSIRDDNKPDPVLVRAWAVKNGLEVNARGRVPSEIVEKYQAANG
jgi:hypothetical protein